MCKYEIRCLRTHFKLCWDDGAMRTACIYFSNVVRSWGVFITIILQRPCVGSLVVSSRSSITVLGFFTTSGIALGSWKMKGWKDERLKTVTSKFDSGQLQGWCQNLLPVMQCRTSAAQAMQKRSMMKISQDRAKATFNLFIVQVICACRYVRIYVYLHPVQKTNMLGPPYFCGAILTVSYLKSTN